MAGTTSRLGLGAFGLLAALGMPLAAQTLLLPASDPVGIARAGAGVAFGNSLEAASLNPALLVSLREDSSAFVSAGMEMQSAQATLQANSQVLFSSDRNRFLPALGTAWKLRPDFAVGFKVDTPFMRHVQMPTQYSGRFEGQNLDLEGRRMEFQASWAANPNWSFGASVGFTRIQYSFENSVRVLVPDNPLLPANPQTNPTRGLMELGLIQEGKKTAPSYALGFRWAINPRWTVGGAWQSSVSANLGLKARVDTSQSPLVGISGYGPADGIAVTAAPAVLAANQVTPGNGSVALPGKLTVGIRQRVNQIFTWEGDLRYVRGTELRLPGYATLAGPSGVVSDTGLPGALHNGFGYSLAGEMALTKRLTARIGFSQDAGIKEDTNMDPTLGGAKSAAFSFGLGWRVFGGEVNFGWQTRQSQDRDVTNLDGQWSANGYSTTGTSTRVENMGHLWSIGYRKAF